MELSDITVHDLIMLPDGCFDCILWHVVGMICAGTS